MLTPNAGLFGYITPVTFAFIEEQVAKAAVIIGENCLAFDIFHSDVARNIHISEAIFVEVTKPKGKRDSVFRYI